MAKFHGILIGLATAFLLLSIIGLSRLLSPSGSAPDLMVREIEVAAMAPPPPPPPTESEPDVAPPPPIALPNVAELPDHSRIPIPKAALPIDITMPVEPFFEDVDPAPLPEPKKQLEKKPAVKSKTSPRQAQSSPRPDRAVKKPVVKAHYSVGELDGKPRLIRHGSAAFPTSLARQGITQGTVVFEVELTTRGSVKIRRVVSATHRELVSPARRVASSSKFSPPKRQGQAVKAIMRWPITIRK